jgi:3-oxo-5-alpha-steroid 4-dehydrogenase 1
MVRFIIGIATFFLGMTINIHADYTLIGLRKPGDTKYYIPQGSSPARIPVSKTGGAFEYVSGANFFGEIVEWTGFAICTWSFPV